MPDYGTANGVKALTAHINYDGQNAPTGDDLDRWLAARSGQLNGWLAAAGYAVPVTQADAQAALDRFAEYGAAADAEATQRTGGYRDEDEDRREVYFAAEFRRAEAWINSGAPGALGVPIGSDPGSSRRPSGGGVGVIVAGTAADPRLRNRGGLR